MRSGCSSAASATGSPSRSRCNGLDDRGLARRLTKRERAEQPAGTPVSTRGSAAE